MNSWRNCFAAGLAAAIALCVLCGTAPAALAQGYPDKPVTIIVPYPAGGVMDLTARALADGLTKHMSQPVVVLNKVGAGATMGGGAVASAAADGYTLGFFPIAAAAPEVFRFAYTAPYSSNDIKAVAAVASTALSFAVRTESPLKSMKDVIDLARQKGGLQIGTPGKQTLPSMIMVKMAKKENVKLEDIAFGGDAKTLPALLGGHIEVGAVDFAALKPSVQAGKLRLLAVCAETRLDAAPDVPTVIELGYEMPYVSSLGVFVPKATPEDLVHRIEALVATVTREPQFAARMKEMSIQVAYKDSGSSRKAVTRDRDNLEAFFRDQGLYK
jgi:tripartite-type tricarboxylate transporter receptor subunit TctC